MTNVSRKKLRLTYAVTGTHLFIQGEESALCMKGFHPNQDMHTDGQGSTEMLIRNLIVKVGF